MDSNEKGCKMGGWAKFGKDLTLFLLVMRNVTEFDLVLWLIFLYYQQKIFKLNVAFRIQNYWAGCLQKYCKD